MDMIDNSARYAARPRAGIFVAGDVAAAFTPRFLDEDECRRWILGCIYAGQDITCPQCSASLTEKGLRRFWVAGRVRCASCGKFFTAVTGTFLQGSHLTFAQIVLLAVFLHFGIHPTIIADKVGISTETVRLWQVKFSALSRLRIIEGETLPDD